MKNKKGIHFTKDILIRTLLTTLIATIFCLVYFFQFEIICFFDKTNYSAIAKSDFEVCFFDVGQGDSTYIRYKDISILIDAGPSSSSKALVKDLKDVNRGKEIDYFFVTHPDSDHTGGGEEVFKNFNVKNFYRPVILSSTEYSKYGDNKGYGVDDTIDFDKTIMAGYEEKDCQMVDTMSDRILFEGEFALDVLYPTNISDVSPSNSNSYSTVIKVIYGSFSYLFMADANFTIENKLLSEYGEILDCDVLKVAHHGSKYATSSDFLEVVTPRYAIISVGKSGLNIGHAGEELKDRLNAVEAKIYLTYDSKNILFGNDIDYIIFTFEDLPNIHIGIISVVCAMIILLIWGIRVPQKAKKIKNIN